MHTASTLDCSMFRIELEGKITHRDAFLDWQPQDRLGVVVTSPLGALGASMLMQLATTADYDARPARRTMAHYPEVYIFHVGGRFGDFSAFDVAPWRKEVFLGVDACIALQAINDRAITHLAVPDRAIKPELFPWSEGESARDRVRRCFAYDASGQALKPDVSITSLDTATHHETALTLEPQLLLDEIASYVDSLSGPARTFAEQFSDRVRSRMTEVTNEYRTKARQKWQARVALGNLQETYRRIEVEDALGMLTPYL